LLLLNDQIILIKLLSVIYVLLIGITLL